MGSPRGLPQELKKTDFPNTLPVISHAGKPIKQGLLRDQLENTGRAMEEVLKLYR